MIKDADQKIRAVRYCVALGLVPYMEVVVRHVGDTARRPTDITDIDVLAIQPAAVRRSTRTIFDCKTLGSVSPINRALWACGLKSYSHADEAFVILKKPAPEGHRLAAGAMGVRLFSDELFLTYITSTTSEYPVETSYLANPQGWEGFSTLATRSPNLEPFHRFLSSEAPLLRSPAEALRTL